MGVKIEFVPTDWKTLVNGVVAGQYHMTGSASISPPRMKVAGFSDSYIAVEIYPFTTEDKAGRFAQFAKNLDFFGAPAAIFCFVDRIMGPPQWSDLGMFLQTFMLLAQEAGLDTCPQEAWAVHEAAVTEFVGAPDEQRIFCGVALGKADWDAPINSVQSEREPLEVFAKFV